MKKPLMVALFLLVPMIAHAQWMAGLRAGYAMAGGNAVSGSPMSSGLKSNVAIQVEGGYKLLRSLTVGAYGSYGPGQVGSTCAGATCSASVLRLGVEANWQFQPVLALIPWLGAGTGYEWATYKASAGPDTLKVTLGGFELLRLEAGADYGITSKFSIGPFASYALGRYGSLKVTSPLGNSSGGAPNTGTHTWLAIGVRSAYEF